MKVWEVLDIVVEPIFLMVNNVYVADSYAENWKQAMYRYADCDVVRIEAGLQGIYICVKE